MQIVRMAHERGMKASEVASHLALYRSNLSLMDSGKRSVSLRTLTRIADFLGCSPSDLIVVRSAKEGPLFRRMRTREILKRKEEACRDGEDKSWVHHVLLNWQRHTRLARRIQ